MYCFSEFGFFPGFIMKDVRDEGEKGLRSWQGLSGPKLSGPIRLDSPQNPARLVTYKAGRPANPRGLRPGRWDRRPKMPAPPLKGALPPRRNAARCQPLRFSLLLRNQSLAAPSSALRDGGAAFLLAALGRGIRAGAGSLWDHRNNTASGELGGIPRPGPPTCLALFPQPGVMLSPWAPEKLGSRSWHAHPPAARCGFSLLPSSNSLLPHRLGPLGAERGGNLQDSAIARSTSLPNSRHILPFWLRLQHFDGFGLPTPHGNHCAAFGSRLSAHRFLLYPVGAGSQN